MDIQRYDLKDYINDPGIGPKGKPVASKSNAPSGMFPAEFGEWVKAEDVNKILNEMWDRNREIVAQAEALKLITLQLEQAVCKEEEKMPLLNIVTINGFTFTYSYSGLVDSKDGFILENFKLYKSREPISRDQEPILYAEAETLAIESLKAFLGDFIQICS
jgi:hypothetical protein